MTYVDSRMDVFFSSFDVVAEMVKDYETGSNETVTEAAMIAAGQKPDKWLEEKTKEMEGSP